MAKAEKLDLYKKHKADYAAGKRPALVTVGQGQYLAISGEGAPGGEAFTAAVGVLYGAAFTLKMASKSAGRDYKVCPLEALWWADDDSADLDRVPRDAWRWKLLIRTPSFIGPDDLDSARRALLTKGKGPEVTRVELEALEEGPCVQMLHVGPYAEEARTIEAMSSFARDRGLFLHGRHHEIYLSDPRRVPPERLRTILRHPVRPA